MSDISREDALAHFGVKGQKWGVRNTDDSNSNASAKKEKLASKKVNQNELTKKYMAAKPPKFTKEEDAKAHAESRAKFKAKFEPPKKELSAAEKAKAWRPTKKQVAVVAAGAAIAGLYVYGKQSGKTDQFITDAKNYIPDLIPGESCSSLHFNKAVSGSASRSWGAGGYIKDSSFLANEQTFPIGHVFHRLATTAEANFSDSTYCTPDIADFNRYVSAFRHEKGYASEFHHVTWKATKEIKVPALTTTLETMRQTLTERFGDEATHEQAKNFYNNLSGGAWDHNDPITKSFFSKLSNQGYHAIVDEMDAGVIGEKPMVFFDAKAATKKTSELLTKKGIALAENSLTEITNRK